MVMWWCFWKLRLMILCFMFSRVLGWWCGCIMFCSWCLVSWFLIFLKVFCCSVLVRIVVWCVMLMVVVIIWLSVVFC